MYSNCIKVKDKDIGTYVKAKYRIYEFAIGLKVSNSIIWVCWEVCVGQGERECVSRIFCLRSRLHSTDFVDYLRVRVITNETNWIVSGTLLGRLVETRNLPSTICENWKFYDYLDIISRLKINISDVRPRLRARISRQIGQFSIVLSIISYKSRDGQRKDNIHDVHWRKIMKSWSNSPLFLTR